MALEEAVCGHCGGVWRPTSLQGLCPWCRKPWRSPKGLHARARVLPQKPQAQGSRRVRFASKERAKDYRCVRCARRGRSARARSWHHWLPQEHIRTYVAAQRFSEAQAREVLRKLLHDSRNVSPVCGDCHSGHETSNPSDPFLRADVPASAFEFAAELGPAYTGRLERAYPNTRR